MKLVNIGFGSMVQGERIVAIVSPESMRAVLIMDSEHVISSALQPETIAGRLSAPAGECAEF